MSLAIDNLTQREVIPVGFMVNDQLVNYGEFVATLVKEMGSDASNLMHAAIGISGEAGELLDAVKKYWVYNKPLDVGNIHEELGDLMFYVIALMMLVDTTMVAVLEHNVKKLTKRYPVGYTDAAAQQRADKLPATQSGLQEQQRQE